MRSQIAQAYARWYGGPLVDVDSAGVHAADSVHPDLRSLLEEIGVPLGGHVPQSLEHRPFTDYDVVVTLCDPERVACPIPPPGPRHVQWSIPAPDSSLAPMEGLRVLRDEILAHVTQLIDDLTREES